MGGGVSADLKREKVTRLELGRPIDDDLTVSYFRNHRAHLLTTGSGGKQYLGPNLLSDESALFWYIRLQYRTQRRSTFGLASLGLPGFEHISFHVVDYSQQSVVPEDVFYSIVADDRDIASAEHLSGLITERCLVLSLSNSSVDDEALFQFASAVRSSKLASLSLHGTNISAIDRLTPLFPNTLLSLDLSMTRDLTFTVTTFQPCFQLIRLILDGCGLTSTSITDNTGNQVSMFQSLYCLEELSLKENDLDGIPSIQGIFYFGFANISPLPHDISLSAFGRIETGSYLKRLHLLENPIFEIPAVAREVITMLSKSIRSLEFVDDVSVHHGVIAASGGTSIKEKDIFEDF